MKQHHCVTREGEAFVILQNDDGIYLCPICGSAEFDEPPYDSDGNASFQMCSCAFEYGYDDSPFASKEAVSGVVPNWDRWRLKAIQREKHTNATFQRLETNLKAIGYKLAFDLIPVRIDENT